MITSDLIIVSDKHTLGGNPRIAGTRIGVHHVIGYLRLYEGDLEKVRAEALEHLSMEELRAAVAWYVAHPEVIDTIIRENRETYERGLRNQAMIKLVDGWIADTSGYEEEAWPDLKKALNENRKLSGDRRELFPPE